ncbi:MAG TPA: 4a-hydroxytetrahydrobiopterin dehydratase [Candidatus Dormibacteraeota bacterium]|nr:4a-hydroxytetrahydrobiopterin dehydratase [Candidatus Dormibacteraeota bacterium]
MADSERAAAITSEDARRALKLHPSWVVERDRLRRDFRLASFKDAMQLINRVATVAEAQRHHPNIRLHEWCFVELEVYSHVTGGLTTRDVDLATAIDAALDGDAPA